MRRQALERPYPPRAFRRFPAEQSGVRYMPAPVERSRFSMRPSSGAAALQQDAVDLLLPQLLHQLQQVYMPVFTVQAKHPASCPHISSAAFQVCTAGSKDRRYFSRGHHHLRLQRRPQMGIANDADRVFPALHVTGQRGSSVSTVPTPTMIPLYRCRCRCGVLLPPRP